jgi:hypothetical protein
MCTVSAAFSEDGSALRLVINRDERRLRPQARPPARFEASGVPAIWPVDQEGGGTWAAVNGHGVAFALLNTSGPVRACTVDGPIVSRGAVIPHLAAAATIEEAERAFAGGPVRWPCRPFKLLVATIDRAVLLTPGGVSDVDAPFVLGTSSLGDSLVDQPRRELFEQLLQTSATAWQAQDRLHQHAWPDRRHLSVLMSRPDACTVSRTEIVITGCASEMRYAALVDGWPMGVSAPAVAFEHRRAAAAA